MTQRLRRMIVMLMLTSKDVAEYARQEVVQAVGQPQGSRQQQSDRAVLTQKQDIVEI
jgi:hypothetical protein